MNQLQQTISQFITLSQSELTAIRQHAQVWRIKKGDVYQQEDTVCRKLGFLQKGVLRVYHSRNEKEITKYFNTEGRNPFVASFKSFLTGRPSHETIVALEDCEMLTIKKTELENLYERFHQIETLGRKLAEYNYLLGLERIDSLQYQSAGTRYEQFLKLYPGLINRVPHHYIASYLGVTAESLSRIRSMEQMKEDMARKRAEQAKRAAKQTAEGETK